MTGSDPGHHGSIASWAFRLALSGLPEGQVRDMLESDRCPQPAHPDWEAISAFELSGEVVIHDTEKEEAWIQSTEFIDRADIR